MLRLLAVNACLVATAPGVTNMRKLRNDMPLLERRALIAKSMRDLDQLYRKPEKNNAATPARVCCKEESEGNCFNNEVHHTKPARQRKRVSNCASYEAVKSSLTAAPLTPQQYQAACMQAAKIAGV